jgi:hypothetical protein
VWCGLIQTIAKLSNLNLGQLANVQTVGIGLYLALAVIQALSAGGVAGLRRRATTLQTAVRAARVRSEFASMHQLQSDISRLEIGFQAVNRTILLVVLALFVVSLVYFAYCTAWQGEISGIGQAVFIIIYYLVVPVIVFLAFAILISVRCRETGTRIKAAEKRWLALTLGAGRP